jgi:hypothetical protein
VVCMDFRDGLCEWVGHGPSPWLLIYWTMMQCAAGKGNMEPKMPLSDAAVCCSLQAVAHVGALPCPSNVAGKWHLSALVAGCMVWDVQVDSMSA